MENLWVWERLAIKNDTQIFNEIKYVCGIPHCWFLWGEWANNGELWNSHSLFFEQTFIELLIYCPVSNHPTTKTQREHFAVPLPALTNLTCPLSSWIMSGVSTHSQPKSPPSWRDHLGEKCSYNLLNYLQVLNHLLFTYIVVVYCSFTHVEVIVEHLSSQDVSSDTNLNESIYEIKIIFNLLPR